MSYNGNVNLELIPVVQADGTTVYRQRVQIVQDDEFSKWMRLQTSLLAAMWISQGQAFGQMTDLEDALQTVIES